MFFVYRSGVGDSTSEGFLLFVLTPQEEDDNIVGEMLTNLCKLIELRQRYATMFSSTAKHGFISNRVFSRSASQNGRMLGNCCRCAGEYRNILPQQLSNWKTPKTGGRGSNLQRHYGSVFLGPNA